MFQVSVTRRIDLLHIERKLFEVVQNFQSSKDLDSTELVIDSAKETYLNHNSRHGATGRFFKAYRINEEKDRREIVDYF